MESNEFKSLVDIMQPYQNESDNKAFLDTKQVLEKWNKIMINTTEIEQKKYFIPEVSDLRVGYECEVTPTDKNLWGYTIIDSSSIKSIEYKTWEARTPYLTKEQIIEDGWVFSHRFEGGNIENYEENYKKEFSGGYFGLSINQNRFVSISQWICIDSKNPNSQTRWRGIIPSINELRLIEKLLGI